MTMNDIFNFLHVDTFNEFLWVVLGFSAQLMFSGRFLVQWIASERARTSVVPVAFWWLSIAGGLTLLTYAIYRRDPVFIMGQSLGVFIYIRNLWLIYKTNRRQDKKP